MDKEHRFFEKYAPTWDHDRNEDAEKLQFLLHLIGIPQGAHVLDVGCGTGVLVPYLQHIVGADGTIEGLDYAEAMIAKGKEKFASLPGITFTVGNVLTCDLRENAYDAVTCLNFYPHIQRSGQAFMKRMYKALKSAANWPLCTTFRGKWSMPFTTKQRPSIQSPCRQSMS